MTDRVCVSYLITGFLLLHVLSDLVEASVNPSGLCTCASGRESISGDNFDVDSCVRTCPDPLYYHTASKYMVVSPGRIFFGFGTHGIKSFAITYKDWLIVADIPCGKASTNLRAARVVGGEDAVPREFPWLVSITRMGGHFCGGTIINSRYVLTAAHCLCSGTSSIPPRQLRVTLGEHNLKGPEVPASIVESVINVNVHPGHKCGQYADDIAILELAGPISWSQSVQPACLPTANGDPGYTDFEGTTATAAGWGWLGEDRSRNKRADILQKVGVNVVDNNVCKEWYANQGKRTRVGPYQMCAGHESGGRDACWADSGGPLMVGSRLGAGTMVVGVVSSGVGCGRPQLPGIYTRISEYIPWITQQALSKR